MTARRGAATASLLEHPAHARQQDARELTLRAGRVTLWRTLVRKLPDAGHASPWQWIFPGAQRYRGPVSVGPRQHACTRRSSSDWCHRRLREQASRSAVTCRTPRHSLTAHLLDDLDDIRTA